MLTPSVLFREVESSLSAARLGPYRSSPVESGDTILGRYLWNNALAESLYPTLHYLEVAIRNALHGSISRLAGEDWLDKESVLVHPPSWRDVQKAKKTILDSGRSVSANRLVAELGLGFWAGLTSKIYERRPRPSQVQLALWPGVMGEIGPSLPRELRTRKNLSDFLDRARRIRNRAYHHEPLWMGVKDRKGIRQLLSNDHEQMQQFVQSLSPGCATLMRMVDRFPAVFDAGPGPWADAISVYCAQSGFEL